MTLSDQAILVTGFRRSIGRAIAEHLLAEDFNRDGAVNAADYTVWMDNFLTFEDDHPADANGDGFVGNVDYDIWAANYGLTTPPPPRSIPEPSGLMVAVASLFAISWRRFSPPWRTHT